MSILSALFATGVFVFLLGSGARIFGAALGSPTRGAVIPLLAIPLAADWFRFLLKFSPSAAMAVSFVAYAVVALVYLLWARPGSPFAAMTPEIRRNWWRCFAILLVIHFFLRLWLFTGTVPNPADDAWAGYKTAALLHSPSWPTMMPDEPELAMSYYYYGWDWSAAFASWVGAIPRASWWATAIVLCIAGAMLVVELVLPRMRTRRDLILGTLVIFNGCTLSVLTEIFVQMPPKFWMLEVTMVARRYGLYMRTPMAPSYWTPSAVLASGLVVVVVFALWRALEERRMRWMEAVFIVLALASLPGYCTFHILGFVLVVLPPLAVGAVLAHREEAFRRWLPQLTGLGLASALVCLPLLLTLFQRAPGTHMPGAFESLPKWIHTAPERYGWPIIVGFVIWGILSTALGNVLIFPVLFRRDRKPLPPLARVFVGIFFLGAVACLFGVADNFVSKFGGVIALAALMAFFALETRPKWSLALILCGLIGPSLMALNIVRANIFLQKIDPVWQKLDEIAGQTHEVVLYDVPQSARDNRLWLQYQPYNSSKARIIEPVQDIEDQRRIYMSDPGQLKKLPPTEIRLRRLMGDAPTYLLLRTGTAAPMGERLYSSKAFSLDRVKADDSQLADSPNS